MFGFAWSEFAVIAVVALIAIGPKDLPMAIRGLTGAIKKARRMASEFQTHVDEMVREANLGEVRDHLSQIRNFNVASVIGKTVDPDGSLRDSLSDPFATPPVAATASEARADAPVAEMERPSESPAEPPPPRNLEPPAFIPPRIAAAPAAKAGESIAPAFIPPSAAQSRPPSP